MWLATGAIGAALLFVLFSWLSSKGVKAAWYEILIAVLGVVLMITSAQNYFGFKAEFQPEAANQSLVVLGLPGLFLVAVAASLIWRRQNASRAVSK